jgi:hypothetical protein
MQQSELSSPVVVRWPYPARPTRPFILIDDDERAIESQTDDESAEGPAASDAEEPCTGIRVVINGRVVVQRNFLQDTVQSMVRNALAQDAA